MAMDPKQERALRDGTASEADQPRRIDKESVRAQEENPPVDERPRGRRRTAAVADVRIDQEAGTPVDQMAREIGAEPVPEMGRAPRNRRNGNGHGNGGTAPEPSLPLLGDELPEDRGSAAAEQDERNPNLQTGSDQRPGPPSRAFSLDAARDAAAMPNSAPRPRPIADVKRAGSTSSRAVTKRAPAKRAVAGRPTASRATAKRAAPTRATAKRAAPKRAAPTRAPKRASRGTGGKRER